MKAKGLQLSVDLVLPLSVVTEKVAWLGRTGSGKSYGAMKLAELMLESGAQIGVLDPVGVWRSLRVPAVKDGKAFDVVVLGGLYGDLPLNPSSGTLVADLVVDRGLSFVLDVSQFIPSEQQEFARAFAHRFFHRKKSAPSAVHLFLEECQEFIPENPSGREALTLGEFQRLWKLGRNFGIGGSLISQRPQEIAKKALNMSGTLFAFQMTGPQERKAIRAWVADQGVATDIEAVLQKLRVGEPHVESPTFLEVSKSVRILPRVTADLSSTPTVGAATAARRPLTPIDVEALKVAMADTIEKAADDDPKELRKRLAAVTAELRKLEAAKVDAKPVPVQMLSDADRTLLEQLGQQLGRFQSLLTLEVDGLIDRAVAKVTEKAVDARSAGWQAASHPSIVKLRDTIDRMLEAPTVSGNPVAALSRSVERPPASVPAPGQARPVDARIERAAERKILTALAMYYPTATRSSKQVAILSGYALNGGGFRNALGRMRSLGFIEGTGERLQLTAAGAEALGPVQPLPRGRALFDHWMSQLDRKAEREILQVLVDVFPEYLTADQVAARTESRYEPGGGGFRNALGKLRTLELVDGRANIRASQDLFA